MGASSGAQWCTSPSPAWKGYSFINVDSQRPYKISRDEVTNRDYRPMKMGFLYLLWYFHVLCITFSFFRGFIILLTPSTFTFLATYCPIICETELGWWFYNSRNRGEINFCSWNLTLKSLAHFPDKMTTNEACRFLI